MVGRSSSVVIMLALAAIASSLVAAAQSHPLPTGGNGLIRIKYKASDEDEATLAISRDDTSMLGFANRSGHWYAFPGNEHLVDAPCTTLPFSSSYHDLIGGLHNLPGVALGKEPSMQATRVLSTTQDPATTGGDHVPLKRALAALKVITTESLRLKPIEEAVSKGWETEARVAAEHLPYIEHWDTMSFEILSANLTGKWRGPFTELLRKTANIHSMEEALAVVNVLVDPSFQDLLKAHAREP